MLERQWLIEHLHTSMDDFIVALQQVPAERFELRPPVGMGGWSTKRQIFHVTDYEKYVALPSMKLWFDGAPIDVSELQDEETLFEANTQSLDELILDFKNIRKEQIELCKSCSDATWIRSLDTPFWGRQPLYWIVSKTWQHTIEHMTTTLQIALFWDIFVTMQQNSEK